MAEGGASIDRSLEQTPTWAVAVVCFAFVVISLILEQSIHRVSSVSFCFGLNTEQHTFSLI